MEGRGAENTSWCGAQSHPSSREGDPAVLAVVLEPVPLCGEVPVALSRVTVLNLAVGLVKHSCRLALGRQRGLLLTTAAAPCTWRVRHGG